MRPSYVLSFLIAAFVAVLLFGQFQRAEDNVNNLTKVLNQANSAAR